MRVIIVCIIPSAFAIKSTEVVSTPWQGCFLSFSGDRYYFIHFSTTEGLGESHRALQNARGGVPVVTGLEMSIAFWLVDFDFLC